MATRHFEPASRFTVCHRGSTRIIITALWHLFTVSVAATTHAQTTADILVCDSAFSARAVPQALECYERILSSDRNVYELYWKASRAAITLAEFNTDAKKRDSLFSRAEQIARRAVAAKPADAEGHFFLARARGRIALTVGLFERARFAAEIHSEAVAALRADPNHAGALHVLGLWHQNVMQVGKLQRLAARTILGAKYFGLASWSEAQRCLESAVILEPNVIAHRLDLARLYALRGEHDKARSNLRWIIAAPSVDFNDDSYRREAEVVLRSLEKPSG